ncbi:flagellar biosynthesis regulator FlaF [Pannonibacter sp. SL95]|jgi:flagellar protein FlaF|uniref:flagellar biosynthesis regulator FlaF n=1 Tax=Pannonibacter sp. SL95 TaxID=2995153 RepID=UPI0022763492|nr:flagellar biosynthesis regulator FlaF [Pannonibacter sp. SL95]MCY1707177.1 flagellar biosynthesis regulator FlaF [Pannonibacter sp. SL95]
MYNFSYAEAIDDFGRDQRAEERQAMDLVIAQLELARERGPRSRETIEAVYNTRRLWSYFIDNLAEETNELPVEIRADLISIGIWVIKELERIRRQETDSLDALIEINIIIRDSLAR